MRISDWSSDVCSSDLVQGYIYGRPMDLDGVLALIGEGGGRVVAQGYQSAREPRRHILRRIEVTSGGYRYDANVRNNASGGALIEGLWNVPPGAALTLDFGGGPRLEATALWSDGHRGGVQFAATIRGQALRNASG